MRWNETAQGFDRGDGKILWLTYVRTREQAERWQSAGFDIAAAIERMIDFLKDWSAADTFLEAHALLDRFLRHEEGIASDLGLGDDPDIQSIRRSAKAFEWSPRSKD